MMLRYFVVATVLVVGSLVIAAHFSRPRKPIDVSGGPKSHGTPSAPRPQPTISFPPRGVHGEAPWALSALPECFQQEEEAHGPPAFVRAHVPARMQPVAAPSHLETTDCALHVFAHSVVVERGTERLVVPPETRLFSDGRRFALLRQAGKAAELRIYHLPGNGPVTFVSGAY
jgi:hypothetical protein